MLVAYTESVADQTTAGKQRSALAELRAFVPLGKQEQSTREESCLDEPKEETGQQNAGKIVRNT